MSKIFVPAYWPFFKTAELRRFDYTDPTGALEPITSVFSYDKKTDSMLYDDFNKDGTWRDRWYYQYRPGKGVSEWQDEEPMPSAFKLLGSKKRVVMDPPIGWGEFLSLGETYISKPKMTTLKCLPPQIASGENTVVIEEYWDEFVLNDLTKYHNVFKMRYKQSWNNNPPVAANYWMAMNVGPIAIQWIALGAPGGPAYSARLDAHVSSVNI